MKVGQEVRVVANTTGHEFEIGEVVRAATLRPNGEINEAEKLDGSDYWYLDEEDVEPIAEGRQTTFNFKEERQWETKN